MRVSLHLLWSWYFILRSVCRGSGGDNEGWYGYHLQHVSLTFSQMEFIQETASQHPVHYGLFLTIHSFMHHVWLYSESAPPCSFHDFACKMRCDGLFMESLAQHSLPRWFLKFSFSHSAGKSTMRLSATKANEIWKAGYLLLDCIRESRRWVLCYRGTRDALSHFHCPRKSWNRLESRNATDLDAVGS